MDKLQCKNAIERVPSSDCLLVNLAGGHSVASASIGVRAQHNRGAVWGGDIHGVQNHLEVHQVHAETGHASHAVASWGGDGACQGRLPKTARHAQLLWRCGRHPHCHGAPGPSPSLTFLHVLYMMKET